MSMESIYSKLAAFVTGFLAFVGIGEPVQAPVLTPEIKAEIQQVVSDEVQDAMTLYVAEAREGPIFGTSQPIAGATYTLSGAGVSNSATSITLSSLTVPQNGYEILDADLSPTFYITLEPGNRTRQEIVSCTTVTQNANNTATLSGCTRGLSPVQPYTADSSLRFSHGGGSQVIFSNPPQFYNEFANLSDDETVTGQWTFNTFPITPSNSPCSTTVAGVCELATQAETAAGTVTGGTGGNLVIANSTATSTYATSTAPNRVITTRTNGTIDPKFFGTTTVTFYSGPASNPSLYVFPTTTVNGIAVSSTTRTTFNASGTWNKPTSGTMAYIEAWGAGGSGGSSSNHAGSGGGGGGYAARLMRLDELGSTVTVTIGAGGTAVSNGNNGNAGGNTTFGAHLTAYGGGAGGVCSNDVNDYPVSGGGGGGPLGAGGSAQTNSGGGFAENAGSPGSPLSGDGNDTNAWIGGAGGGGCTSGTGSAGGSTMWGGGGGGGAHNGGTEGAAGTSVYGGAGGQGQDDTNGTAGTQPGGGGGANSSGGSSGAGADGRIIVTVF